MVSDRMTRFRYRMNARMYEIRRERALKMARMRYRLDNMGAARYIKFALLIGLGAVPFVLFFLFQPDRPTTIADTTSNIGPPPPLAFPTMVPTSSPTPSLEATPSPTPSASPTPSPSPTPARRCSNRRDDDRDGRTDFPADRGCSSRNDNSESPDPAPTPPPPPAPASQPPPGPPPGPAPAPLAPMPPPAPPVCNDGKDNDDDGRVDTLDRGCDGPLDESEDGEPPLPPVSPLPPSPDPTDSPSPTPSGSSSPS